MVIRFWIISFVLALAGLATLKLQVITAQRLRRQALCGARPRALGAGDGRGAAGERGEGDGVGRASDAKPRGARRRRRRRSSIADLD